MVTGLGIHLRPMVRKGQSFFGHISRIFKKNGGSTAAPAENRHFPPKIDIFMHNRHIFNDNDPFFVVVNS